MIQRKKQTNRFTRVEKTLPKLDRAKYLVARPELAVRELCNRSYYYFLQHFWPQLSNDEFKPNWHIEYLCEQLTIVAERVALGLPKLYDVVINVPPGTTKTTTVSIGFPVWCWTKWHWMRFITASYSADLSLESAEYSRDLIRSKEFKEVYPDLDIKQDKDTKSNFRVIKKVQVHSGRAPQVRIGGSRYSTSVNGTLLGFHGHINIVDDPLDPRRAISEPELKKANHWIDETLSTRKVDKLVTPTILIQQRLNQNDPSGHTLAKKDKRVFHICLPGEIKTEGYWKLVRPIELISRYTDGLLDPVRLSDAALHEMKTDLGQYGYAGQVAQNPTPPGGGMFHIDMFRVADHLPDRAFLGPVIRYWDKAGTQDGGAYTAGVKMGRSKDGKKWYIIDVVRGQWSTDQREAIIRSTAEADGRDVVVHLEQEPGSGGKDSLHGSITNLAGFAAYGDRPTGDKVFRADPYSVQVNEGNVILLRGDWNQAFKEEHEFFPNSTYKDQVDAAAAAFNILKSKKKAGSVAGHRRRKRG